jgi:hypothetical protein
MPRYRRQFADKRPEFVRRGSGESSVTCWLNPGIAPNFRLPSFGIVPDISRLIGDCQVKHCAGPAKAGVKRRVAAMVAGSP